MANRLIHVHSAWDGWQAASVRPSDLRDIHWYQPRQAPAPLLHAYVDCTTLLGGGLPHDCDPSSRPHRLLVCVLRRHTCPEAYRDIARQVGPEPSLILKEPVVAVALERRRATRRTVSWGRMSMAAAAGLALWAVLHRRRPARRRSPEPPVSRAFSFGRFRAASA